MKGIPVYGLLKSLSSIGVSTNSSRPLSVLVSQGYNQRHIGWIEGVVQPQLPNSNDDYKVGLLLVGGMLV